MPRRPLRVNHFFNMQKFWRRNHSLFIMDVSTRWQDVEGNHWKSLQYHFFYAFNDWRLAANGINHHEGDWEMVAVYLKNDEPYSVLLSQHGTGAMELWQDVRCVKDKDGK